MQEIKLSQDNNRQTARLSDDFKSIIDHQGNRVEYHDPRVVHIHPLAPNRFLLGMIKKCYEKRGWNCRIGRQVDREMVEKAKKLCTGKECFSLNAFTGANYIDLVENRKTGEISLYHAFNQEGPCQAAGWLVAWDVFKERLNLENAIFFVSTNVANNYLGQGMKFSTELMTITVLADIFIEAESALSCLAQDKREAMAVFDEGVHAVTEAFGLGLPAVDKAVVEWATRLSLVPLKNTIEDAPRVLIFGGGATQTLHYPVTEYFIQQGIVPKTVDAAEFINHLEVEHVMRFGFKRGLTQLKKQMKLAPLLFSTFKSKYDKTESRRALRSGISVIGSRFLINKYRKAAAKSGLLHRVHPSFTEIIEKGHQYSSYNTFCETTINAGGFQCAVDEAYFDGLVQVGSFSCQPYKNSQTIIRGLANRVDIPYTSIEIEGISLSENQYRLLEIIALQARRQSEARLNNGC